jgi:hypothetical protein
MVRELSGKKALLYRDQRVEYWNSYERKKRGRYYHEEIARIEQVYCSAGTACLNVATLRGPIN